MAQFCVSAFLSLPLSCRATGPPPAGPRDAWTQCLPANPPPRLPPSPPPVRCPDASPCFSPDPGRRQGLFFLVAVALKHKADPVPPRPNPAVTVPCQQNRSQFLTVAYEASPELSSGQEKSRCPQASLIPGTFPSQHMVPTRWAAGSPRRLLGCCWCSEKSAAGIMLSNGCGCCQ